MKENRAAHISKIVKYGIARRFDYEVLALQTFFKNARHGQRVCAASVPRLSFGSEAAGPGLRLIFKQQHFME